MTQPSEIVAVIPARGGSKSIPRKNIVPLGGRPLLAWSIEVAKQVPAINRILVSTDDEEIAGCARTFGAEVSMRPPALATDDALVIDTLRDLIARLNNEGRPPRVIVLLEPTCPLRSAEDVESCLKLIEDDTIDSVATFKAAELNPMRAWRIEQGRPTPFIKDAYPWLPRQQLPQAYQLNGAVYAFRADRLRPEHPSILFGNTAAVVMPAERSVDIDNWIDLTLAEAVLARRAAS